MSEVLSSQVQQSRDPLKLSHLSHVTSDTLSSLSSSYMKRSSERLQEISGSEDNVELRLSRRLPSIHTDRQYLETPYKDSGYRDSQNSYIPNFQRPLLRKQVTGRTLASGRSSFDDSQIPASEMSSYMDGPASLNDALTEGLSPSSDWVARVSAFNYLWSLLQQGPKGILEITQNFEKVMKLFFRYLDDPHHKVAQAAFSTLAEIIPSCRKPFESYLERTLPHVFSRLIDPKELVRQPCSATLEIVGKTYNIDSLLPALLRSLDEQRSPKAKLAVIQFANNSFNKHTINADGYSNNGFLKLWLGKLAPLVNDKNVRLKETSISGIISVYSHFDPTAVLNFILSLSVEEQNSLRRALKQYTPRIEVDLMNFLQNKKERQRSKPFYDQSDVVGTSSEEGYVGASKKSHHFGRYSAGSVDDEGGKKWSLTHESTQLDVSIGNAATNESHHAFENIDDCGSDPLSQGTGSVNNFLQKTEMAIEHESSVLTPRLDISRLVSSDGHMAADMNHGGEISISSEFNHEKLSSAKAILPGDSGPSIPQLLHRKSEMEDSIEIVTEKLLHVTKDVVAKVSNEANQCLNIILSQFDPFRFLSEHVTGAFRRSFNVHCSVITGVKYAEFVAEKHRAKLTLQRKAWRRRILGGEEPTFGAQRRSLAAISCQPRDTTVHRATLRASANSRIFVITSGPSTRSGSLAAPPAPPVPLGLLRRHLASPAGSFSPHRPHLCLAPPLERATKRDEATISNAVWCGVSKYKSARNGAFQQNREKTPLTDPTRVYESFRNLSTIS
ncbi:HEAT repeat family protein [Musa troglodytarum]|uniref:HEAT repeat family protein n=1 Tax=Musa troglodytarum TaxID=320322 RepID=A0A9E7JIJ9_9LILI|nr:HEAT repeat family protein [Musa troglodytarum]